MLQDLSATELARMIREREISSEEVTRFFLERIRTHNPKINAVVELREAEALEEARVADRELSEGRGQGLLHGVPITLKDLLRFKGSVSTYGYPKYRAYRPGTDAWVSDRIRRSGAVVVGRTNVPVLGLDWQSRNPVYGRTENPWKSGHTAGGSSGGSAAAVAARLAPLDFGSDIAGSIRYPSHCCGVMGLRPSQDLVPNWRFGPEDARGGFHHFLTTGPLARSIDDLELGLRVLTSPVHDERAPSRSGPRKLRIAWSTSLPGLSELPLSDETRIHLQSLLTRLESAGHTVQRASPPVDFSEAFDLWGRIAGFESTTALPAAFRLFPLRALLAMGIMRPLYGPGLLSRGFTRGMMSSTRSYFRSLMRLEELQADFFRFFDESDLWVTPSSPSEAIAHQKLGRPIRSAEGRNTPYTEFLGGYLCPLGALGHPIVSLPLGLAESGLPLGIQLHGRRHGDFSLLEDAREFVSHLPELGPPPRFTEQ